MVPHNAQFTGDLYGNTTLWRLAMFLQQNTAERASLTYRGETGISYFDTYLFPIPSELRAGWIHLAHTYSPNLQGGTLRSYLNGILALEMKQLGMRVYGAQGAYVKIIFSIEEADGK